MAAKVKTKSKAKKAVGKKKERWSSGSKRSCSNCHSATHNIRTCPAKGGKGSKKAKKK